MTYTVEPTDHWRAGDRAYCVRGLRVNGRNIVELGRVYVVSEAKSWPGMMGDGLRLVGINTGDVWGFYSNRFACVRGEGPMATQIDLRCRRSWIGAYSECRDARSAAIAQDGGA